MQQKRDVLPQNKRINLSIDSFRGFLSVYDKNTKQYLCEGVLIDVDFAVVTSRCIMNYESDQVNL